MRMRQAEDRHRGLQKGVVDTLIIKFPDQNLSVFAR